MNKDEMESDCLRASAMASAASLSLEATPSAITKHKERRLGMVAYCGKPQRRYELQGRVDLQDKVLNVEFFPATDDSCLFYLWVLLSRWPAGCLAMRG